MSKYIIFKAEHYDGSKKPIPQPGYRLRDFHTVEKFIDPQFPGASTHSRVGDWEVTKVEEYVPNLPTGGFESVVICYCHYSPMVTPLEPLPRLQFAQELQQV
jgi:hypothetical protein